MILEYSRICSDARHAASAFSTLGVAGTRFTRFTWCVILANKYKKSEKEGNGNGARKGDDKGNLPKPILKMVQSALSKRGASVSCNSLCDSRHIRFFSSVVNPWGVWEFKSVVTVSCQIGK
jgi:hypothetical protein